MLKSSILTISFSVSLMSILFSTVLFIAFFTGKFVRFWGWHFGCAFSTLYWIPILMAFIVGSIILDVVVKQNLPRSAEPNPDLHRFRIMDRSQQSTIFPLLIASSPPIRTPFRDQSKRASGILIEEIQ